MPSNDKSCLLCACTNPHPSCRKNNNNNNKYSIQSNSRYVQITPPDLSNFPMRVIIVDDINELGGNTSRGDLGFGSTGQ